MLTPDEIKLRNKWLLKFFRTLFPDKITLINSDENPAVIYNHLICLSCYIKDMELRFMDKPRGGELIYSFQLTESLLQYDIEKVQHWFKNCDHRTVHRLKLNDTFPVLYLSGYNFINYEQKTGKYPVFSHHKPKVYLSMEGAGKVIALLKQNNYKLSIC